MQRFIDSCVRFLFAEQGTSGLEYAVLLGLIVSSSVGGILVMGNNAQTAMQTASSGAGGANNVSSSSGTSTSTTTTPTSTPTTVFADNFSNPTASAAKWSLNGSWWKVANGSLIAGPVSGSDGLFAYAIGSTFSNGTVSMNATLNAGWGYGLMFDLSGNPANGNFNGYSFQYDTGYGTGAFTLHKWVNGVEIQPPLATDFPASTYNWYGVQRAISVTRQGSLITCSVDGQVVISISDSSYTTGGIAIRLWDNPSATFDNFSVTSN